MRAVASSLALVAALAFAPSALADTPTTLTVVGTSDASDSGLVPNVLQPAFSKAYPQFTFKYIGTATGTAISDAESGSVGASALIVHAASLENQFVHGGYSYEQYGRAIFTNDFVLAGATADPAGVAANGAHNIAQSFADIATAGAAGKATFVSRGGTPGTTVEEHKLWALVLSSHLAPASLLLCAVNATSGGGDTPIASGNGVANSGDPCPNGGALPTASELPSWYVATGLTQGPNVIAANACNFPNGNSSCYVLTDRGTYDYLASGTDPAGAIPGLTIVSRDNAAASPGGANELINYFHSYVINPSRAGETVNLTAAQDWANFLTAQTTQELIAAYLNKTTDSGGAPFKPDASPLLTVTGLERTYHAGKPATLTGRLTNAEPGYPPLSGVRVTVSQIAGTVPVPVASAKTDGTGSYRISFTPPVSGSYEVDTPAIAKVRRHDPEPGVRRSALSVGDDAAEAHRPRCGDLSAGQRRGRSRDRVRVGRSRLRARARHGHGRRPQGRARRLSPGHVARAGRCRRQLRRCGRPRRGTLAVPRHLRRPASSDRHNLRGRGRDRRPSGRARRQLAFLRGLQRTPEGRGTRDWPRGGTGRPAGSAHRGHRPAAGHGRARHRTPREVLGPGRVAPRLPVHALRPLRRQPRTGAHGGGEVTVRPSGLGQRQPA